MNRLVARVPFLSEAWVAALDGAASAVTVDPTVSLVLQHDVEGDGSYWMAVDGGRVSFGPGPRQDAAVTYRVSREIARAVATGEQTAAGAFVAGELKVEGRVGEVLGAAAVLEEIAAAVAPVVRDQTDFTVS